MEELELPVAVLNTSKETIEIIADVLEEEGYRVVTDYILPYRRGQKDIADFFRRHTPRAVVYDIAPPYEANWQFFKQVRDVHETKECAFVLTTTNKQQLEALVGATDSIQFVGKPFDLDQLLAAVQQAYNC